jgi:hypothetical protein
MRRACCFALLFLLPLACSSSGPEPADTSKNAGKSGKGSEVELDGLRSQAPAEWKEERPTSEMRLTQFRLPRQKGDEQDAELVIFQRIGGTAEQNVKRWKGQFEPPEGKKIDDVAKVRTFTAGGASVTYLDVQGTFSNAMPGAPRESGKKLPNYRMLAAQFDGEHNIYHIKLTGPARTVEHYKAGFDKWLENFK